MPIGALGCLIFLGFTIYECGFNFFTLIVIGITAFFVWGAIETIKEW